MIIYVHYKMMKSNSSIQLLKHLERYRSFSNTLWVVYELVQAG